MLRGRLPDAPSTSLRTQRRQDGRGRLRGGTTVNATRAPRPRPPERANETGSSRPKPSHTRRSDAARLTAAARLKAASTPAPLLKPDGTAPVGLAAPPLRAP